MTANLAAASPMYIVLAQTLARAIRSGSYRAGQSLPSERLLSESLQVSRETARRALTQLVEQQLVERRRGSGSYVRPLPPPTGTSLLNTAEVLRGYGFTPSSRTLGRQLCVATPQERLALGLAVGERVAKLDSLHLADDVVVACESTVIPAWLLPDPSMVEDTLHEHLAQMRQGSVRALERIRAHNADRHLAKLMQVSVGQAMLCITRSASLASGETAEFTRYFCLSDYLGPIVESRREA